MPYDPYMSAKLMQQGLGSLGEGVGRAATGYYDAEKQKQAKLDEYAQQKIEEDRKYLESQERISPDVQAIFDKVFKGEMPFKQGLVLAKLSAQGAGGLASAPGAGGLGAPQGAPQAPQSAPAPAPEPGLGQPLRVRSQLGPSPATTPVGSRDVPIWQREKPYQPQRVHEMPEEYPAPRRMASNGPVGRVQDSRGAKTSEERLGMAPPPKTLKRKDAELLLRLLDAAPSNTRRSIEEEQQLIKFRAEAQKELEGTKAGHRKELEDFKAEAAAERGRERDKAAMERARMRIGFLRHALSIKDSDGARRAYATLENDAADLERAAVEEFSNTGRRNPERDNAIKTIRKELDTLRPKVLKNVDKTGETSRSSTSASASGPRGKQDPRVPEDI